MGQYYLALVLNDQGEIVWVARPHAYDKNGAKLMEHSYMRNRFMDAVQEQLRHRPQRLVWAGDYADEESNGSTLHTAAGIFEDKQGTTIASAESIAATVSPSPKPIRYLVNHDSKQIVDLDACATGEEWRIHPLSLLTCEGNGRGGGDYNGSGPVGEWARHHISTETKTSIKPFLHNDAATPFTMLTPNFRED
jgi:hypothetical protein